MIIPHVKMFFIIIERWIVNIVNVCSVSFLDCFISAICFVPWNTSVCHLVFGFLAGAMRRISGELICVIVPCRIRLRKSYWRKGKLHVGVFIFPWIISKTSWKLGKSPTALLDKRFKILRTWRLNTGIRGQRERKRKKVCNPGIVTLCYKWCTLKPYGRKYMRIHCRNVLLWLGKPTECD